MEIPDRRTALLSLTGAGLSALLTLPESSQASGAENGDKKELFVVGPYNLGDWFDKKKYEIKGDSNLGVPKRDDIAKSFRECWVYIIDQRVRPAKGAAHFAEDDYPRIAVAGPFHHEFKNGKNLFIIRIASIQPVAIATDDRLPTPARAFLVTTNLMITGETTSSTEAFTVGPLTYNLEGKSV
jgi:hypothetical protein